MNTYPHKMIGMALQGDQHPSIRDFVTASQSEICGKCEEFVVLWQKAKA